MTLTYQSQIRWRWFATRLHVFTFVTSSDRVEEKDIRGFARTCTEYARKEKPGLPRGFQTGSAAVPIMIATEIDDEAVQWATDGVRNRFALLTFPVLVDAASGEVRAVRKIRAWEMLYDAFLRRVVRQHLGDSPKLSVPRTEKRSAVVRLVAFSAALSGGALVLMMGWLLFVIQRSR